MGLNGKIRGKAVFGPVEKSFPIPPYWRRSDYPSIWRDQLGALEIGDSILVQNVSAGLVSPLVKEWGGRLGRVFIFRRKSNGLRIWRVE